MSTTNAGVDPRRSAVTADAPIAVVNAAQPPDDGDQGQSAMFALWLLITTNSTFLLEPAAAARASGTSVVNLVPGPGDMVTSWVDLVNKFKTENENGGFFERSLVEAFLTDFLAKSIDNDQFTSDKTYAGVLQNACTIFQLAKELFVPGWNPPCPKTMDQVPGLKA